MFLNFPTSLKSAHSQNAKDQSREVTFKGCVSTLLIRRSPMVLTKILVTMFTYVKYAILSLDIYHIIRKQKGLNSTQSQRREFISNDESRQMS